MYMLSMVTSSSEIPAQAEVVGYADARFPGDERRMTAEELSKFLGFSYGVFRKMNAARKPARQADGTYRVADIRAWCTRRVTYRKLFKPEEGPSEVVESAPLSVRPPAETPAEAMDELALGKMDREATLEYAIQHAARTRGEIAELEKLLKTKRQAVHKMDSTADRLRRELKLIDQSTESEAERLLREVEEDIAKGTPLPAFAQKFLPKPK